MVKISTFLSNTDQLKKGKKKKNIKKIQYY